MRFASLGSGSQGNALLVEVNRTRILVDCGFGLSEIRKRLARLHLSPLDLAGIIVTHEHEDHIGGVAKLARHYGLPVWITGGTLRGLEGLFFPDVEVHVIGGYDRFDVGDIVVEPFPVPHDAREPAQYVFGDGVRRLGILTDAGYITPHIRRCLDRCHALVLECNHDPGMLQAGDYPLPLKHRIAGRFGHLDNQSAAELLCSLDLGRLQHVVAAHLSQSNNLPELARRALATVLGSAPEAIGVADQQLGTDWYVIS